jgi:excisionase family DNA binding protein
MKTLKEILIAEATEHDFKLMLEEKNPTSWLKSVSAFANGVGTVNEKTILCVLSETPKATYDEMAKRLNIPRRTVARLIKDLRVQGAIVRIGSDKTGYWEVISDGGSANG